MELTNIELPNLFQVEYRLYPEKDSENFDGSKLAVRARDNGEAREITRKYLQGKAPRIEVLRVEPLSVVGIKRQIEMEKRR